MIEELESHPPTWANAALTDEEIHDLLVDHAGAEDPTAVAQAWAAAGLLVVMTRYCMEIRTPEPERRLVGQIRRDYRSGPCSRPYEVVVAEPERPYDSVYNRKVRRLDGVPLDPIAAATRLTDVIDA